MDPRWMTLLWDAIEEAVRCGIGPKVVLKELRTCWREALRQESKRTGKILAKASDNA